MLWIELFRWLLHSGWFLLAHITDRSTFPQKLTPEQEQEAVARMQAGDESARRRLIEHNLRLVAHIAKKYARCGLDDDDLVSIGSIGLIKAVSTFNPSSGRLATYASRCVENEILMVLRANKKGRGNISLNVPIGADREGNEIMLLDILGTENDVVPDEAERTIEGRRALQLIARVLEARERTVIMLRYGLSDGIPHPQHEVAQVLGISRSYVSRIEKKALAKLRQALTGES